MRMAERPDKIKSRMAEKTQVGLQHESVHGVQRQGNLKEAVVQVAEPPHNANNTNPAEMASNPLINSTMARNIHRILCLANGNLWGRGAVPRSGEPIGFQRDVWALGLALACEAVGEPVEWGWFWQGGGSLPAQAGGGKSEHRRARCCVTLVLTGDTRRQLGREAS